LIDCGLGFTGVGFGAGGVGFGGGGGGFLRTFLVVSGNLLVFFWLSLAQAVAKNMQSTQQISDTAAMVRILILPPN